MNGNTILNETWSVCPVCMKRLRAEHVIKGHEVFLRKTCDDHGSFESLIWRGYSDIKDWTGDHNIPPPDNPQCPNGCGLCPDHMQDTCCVILNVTNHCNLDCCFCFADQSNTTKDPTFQEIEESLNDLAKKGKTLVQLSGGEPTIRKDIPEIIKAAKKTGLKFVQLNTNGIRLGEDKKYVKELANAGLSIVFMQFDGTDDKIYEQLRGKSLLEIKKSAIENCSEYNIGVTLVPTIIRSVNKHNIGDILKFAISEIPKIRGVHFQPAAYLGRIPKNPTNEDRLTIDELIFEIDRQTNGVIKANSLFPSSCNHPLCGFHGDFMITRGEVLPLLNRDKNESKCCSNSTPADKRREFITRRWQRPTSGTQNEDSCCNDIQDMEYFLNRIKTHSFTVTAMSFQDADNIDFTRLRNCSLHVYNNGQFVPFCSYYLSGRSI